MGKDITENSVEIGSRIALKRNQMGWSQEDLAKELGLSRNSVARWERGEIVPKFQQLDRLAELLECSPFYLFYGYVEKPLSDVFSNKAIKNVNGLSDEHRELLMKLLESKWLHNFLRHIDEYKRCQGLKSEYNLFFAFRVLERVFEKE